MTTERTFHLLFVCLCSNHDLPAQNMIQYLHAHALPPETLFFFVLAFLLFSLSFASLVTRRSVSVSRKQYKPYHRTSPGLSEVISSRNSVRAFTSGILIPTLYPRYGHASFRELEL